MTYNNNERIVNDPVLAAIDHALQHFHERWRDEICLRHIEAIRTIYLASKQKGDDMCTGCEYDDPTDCEGCPEYTGKGIQSDGGEFERVIKEFASANKCERWIDVLGYIKSLTTAYHADRAADKARINKLEVQLEAYRHANGSKAARIQKMKEQYEEDVRNRNRHIAELEVQLINQSDWYVEWKKWEQAANELEAVLNEVVDYYSKQGTGKVYNLGYSGDTQKEMKLKKAIGK